MTPPPTVPGLQACARRVRTAFGGGDGTMLWHVWGERRADAPPLVLLHGGSGSWTHWLRTVGPLAQQGREVWAADLPGFGDSSLPAGAQDADALIEPLHAGLRDLAGGAPCDLVGFSFGAMTAGMLEAAHPGSARRLVLVGAPAMGVAAARLDLRGWRHLASPEARERVHRHNLATLMLADPAAIDGQTLALHAHNVARDRLQRRRLSNTDVLARALGAAACPVHVIYGALDALYRGRMAELEAAYRRACPALRGFACVPQAGHWVQHERPQAFLGALGAALASAAP